MNSARIEKIQRLNEAIQNFNSCYEKPLWGSCPDGDVRAEQLLEYLIEHPELSEIAEKIDKLNSELSK